MKNIVIFIEFAIIHQNCTLHVNASIKKIVLLSLTNNMNIRTEPC